MKVLFQARRLHLPSPFHLSLQGQRPLTQQSEVRGQTYLIEFFLLSHDPIFHLAKRAETRQCPVCDEHIPLRLLSRHAELESERVEDVIRKIGSSDITYDELDDR